MPEVLELIRELAHYENEPHEVTVTLDELCEDGFELDLFKVNLAIADDQIAGMALFYPRYSTWKGRTIHLEDFIVKKDFRQNRIGTLLFESVVREAQEFGAKRLEWLVLEWNMPAINFYRKVDAEFDAEWEIGKLRETQINNFRFTLPNPMKR